MSRYNSDVVTRLGWGKLELGQTRTWQLDHVKFHFGIKAHIVLGVTVTCIIGLQLLASAQRALSGPHQEGQLT